MENVTLIELSLEVILLVAIVLLRHRIHGRIRRFPRKHHFGTRKGRPPRPEEDPEVESLDKKISEIEESFPNETGNESKQLPRKNPHSIED